MEKNSIKYSQAASKLRTTMATVRTLIENDLLIADGPGYVTLESVSIYKMYQGLAPDTLLQMHMRALKKITELRNANMLYRNQDVEPVDLEFLLTPVWTTTIPERQKRILAKAEARYVFEILVMGNQTLAKFQGYGKVSYDVLKEFFKEHGIDFDDPQISHDIIYQCKQKVDSKEFQSIKHKRVI